MALRIHELWEGCCPLLGPSLYVWVQGCPRRCPGCFNEAALDENGPARAMTSAEIVAHWRRAGAGLVFSGGEPFSQAEGLAEVCRLARAVNPATPVLTYTGYRLIELLNGRRPDWLALLRQIDVLVDGPYVRERQTEFALTGSDNQRIFFLSDRVSPQRLADVPKAHVQVAMANGHLRLVGTGGLNGLDMNLLVEEIRARGIVLED